MLGSLFGPPTSGASFFTAGIILAFMITPIVTSLSREVIATVPAIDREGAYALGATRLGDDPRRGLPHSQGGIVGAVMLGLGRAMGETIAAALVIGSSAQITSHLFAPGDNMPAVIANEWGESTGVFQRRADRDGRAAVRPHDHRERHRPRSRGAIRPAEGGA